MVVFTKVDAGDFLDHFIILILLFRFLVFGGSVLDVDDEFFVRERVDTCGWWSK